MWLILLVVLFICTGVLYSASKSSTTTTATNTAVTQTTDQNTQATNAPTDTPAPTQVSVLTNTDDIKAELKSDATSVLTGSNIITDYGEQLSKGVILESVSEAPPLSFIQTECFNIQKTVWRDPQLNIKLLDFGIAMPDPSNPSLPKVVGECVLDAANGTNIDWNNADAASAWNQKIYTDMTPNN